MGLTAEQVRAEFDRAAPRYDLMVALNPGYHGHLRRAARLLAGSRHVVDLGCGSGASTRAVLAEVDAQSVVGVDASDGMLARARTKAWPGSVRFVQAGAGEVTRERVGGADGVIAAYLFRNVPSRDRDAAVRAAAELLEPGGRFVVEDYSVAGNRIAAAVWTLVCWSIVIPLAAITSRRTTLYRYLWRSVLDFESVEVFSARLRRAGLVDVQARTVGGWQRGILHIVSARKP